MDRIVEPEDLSPSTLGYKVLIVDVEPNTRHEVVDYNGVTQIYVSAKIAVAMRPANSNLPSGAGWNTVMCPKLKLKGYYREVKVKA